MIEYQTKQVKLQITNNALALCKEQQHSQKTENNCGYGVAEAPPDFEAGWSDFLYLFSVFVLFVCSSGISV
jgi:hypothetical protein